MEIRSYPDAGSFLRENIAFLEQEEAANNLLLGLALGLKGREEGGHTANFLSVVRSGWPIFCALQTPPRNLIAYGLNEEAPSTAHLASDFFSSRGIEIPGVFGLKPFIEPFAGSWVAHKGGAWEMKREMGAFKLDGVTMPAFSGGRLRAAEKNDELLALDWIMAFNREALGEADEEQCRKLVGSLLKQRCLFFWEDPLPVSMAAATRPTRNGITINAVYTPPAHRGKGYASNCVARLSQNMLDKGYRFSSLFTDLKNPTSNKIYQAIGYRKVADFVEAVWV